MLENNFQDLLIKIIKAHLPACKILLFGSRARSEHGSRSDIDLALDNSQAIPGHVLLEIKDAVAESNVPFFVDIVDLHTASDRLKKEIERDGVLWNS
ncbi:nucleotidyltransferase domain-containing protein [Candidatus Dependentiae bacterium]|nr:nucleotidyltransferase domain-containing protein [Candidatus Dependentiae bacterium]